MTDSLPTATVEPRADVAVRSEERAATRRPFDRARLAWRRVPADWRYVAGLFLVAKVVLTLTGMVVLNAYHPFLRTLTGNTEITDTEAARHAISEHQWISMWFAWDSFIYHFLERAPLTDQWQEFAFPLLYPFLARATAVVLGGETALALLVVSNVAFVFLLYYAYRLGEQLLGDVAAARRFTRYVVLLPAAFLFQAALTESLFLVLVLAVFFHAERGQWVRVGIFGYFLALSRSIGFLLVVPLALVLLQRGGYRFGPRALWGYVRNGWPLVLLPAGWLTFMAIARWRTGDWFAYQHAQESRWHLVYQSPFRTLEYGLELADPPDLRAWFAIATLIVVLVASVRWLRPAYVAYALLVVLVPLSIGEPVYKSLLRYLVVVFPLALVFAQWARRASVDTLLTSVLALLQGALFVLWLSYWTHFII